MNTNQNKKLILTGANGFVGSYIARSFSDSGYEITAVVRNKNSDISLLKGINNIQIVFCDLDSIEDLPQILSHKNYDLFLHFAWEASAGADRSNTAIQLKNVEATCKAVKTAKELHCNRFVFAGSIMTYEAKEYVLNNNSTPSPTYIYSTAKLTASMMAKITAVEQNIEYINVVISNIYGIGERSMRFLNSTIHKIISGTTELNLTSCEQIYDFIYASDAAQAIKTASLYGENLSSFYIGNREQYPLKKFILDIKDALNSTVTINFGAVEFNGAYFDYHDIIDTNKLSELGFKPRISFKEGIKMLAENIMKEI